MSTQDINSSVDQENQAAPLVAARPSTDEQPLPGRP